MKKQIDLPLIATLAGGVLFNYLFWMEQQALNLMLYSIYILLMLWVDQKVVKGKKMVIAASAHLLAAMLVVFNNSLLTVLTWYISLAIFTGFAYLPAIRSIFFAIAATISQGITVPVNLAKRMLGVKIWNFKIRPIFRLIKYIVIPFILILIFILLYSSANATFERYISLIFSNIEDLITDIFNFFFDGTNFLRLLYLIFGVLFTGALLLVYKNEELLNLELPLLEKLIRTRKPGKGPIVINSTIIPPQPTRWRKMGLKTEAIIGIISFAALNFLLLCLNIIDISNLWIKNTVVSNFNYSAELHEGTNALIWSIVIAMIVILYFFRGNLNFYRKNKTIRVLANLWMIQNTLLIFSVFLRDYDYIDINGLTYKRIGVLIFLLLCIIGLITVYIKVNQQKTFFFLLKINGLCWYCLLLLFGFVNWDFFIGSYNLNKKSPIAIHIEHYRQMSDKIIPLLDSNRAQLRELIIKDNINKPLDEIAQFVELNQLINDKINKFERKWKETTWLSWNYRDWQTHQYLIERRK